MWRKLMTGALCVMVASAVPGASSAEQLTDEHAIIEAVLERHFGTHLPYVRSAVVGQMSEDLGVPAEPAWPSGASSDYRARNATSIQLDDLELDDRLQVSDLTGFGAADAFRWQEFQQQFGDAWVARVSRPGIDGENTAVVRIDTIHAVASAPMRSQYRLEKVNGEWTVSSSVMGIRALVEAPLSDR